jgi:hypothetical protein
LYKGVHQEYTSSESTVPAFFPTLVAASDFAAEKQSEMDIQMLVFSLLQQQQQPSHARKKIIFNDANLVVVW